jgi:hypothetical protein
MLHGLHMHGEHIREFRIAIAEALRAVVPLILALLGFVLFSISLR